MPESPSSPEAEAACSPEVCCDGAAAEEPDGIEPVELPESPARPSGPLDASLCLPLLAAFAPSFARDSAPDSEGAVDASFEFALLLAAEEAEGSGALVDADSPLALEAGLPSAPSPRSRPLPFSSSLLEAGSEPDSAPLSLLRAPEFPADLSPSAAREPPESEVPEVPVVPVDPEDPLDSAAPLEVLAPPARLESPDPDPADPPEPGVFSPWEAPLEPEPFRASLLFEGPFAAEVSASAELSPALAASAPDSPLLPLARRRRLRRSERLFTAGRSSASLLLAGVDFSASEPASCRVPFAAPSPWLPDSPPRLPLSLEAL